MKIKVTRMVEVDPVAIRIEVAVRYGVEDIPDSFPFRQGDMWRVTVDGATGRIVGWPNGLAAECSMKVCDQGRYELLGPEGKVIAARPERDDDTDYVPSCIPGSYGDYIEFEIGPDGTVARWKEFWTADNIRESFFKVD